MANKRISDLIELITPTGDSILPITHQGATRKLSLDNLFTYVDANYFKSGKSPYVTDDLGYRYNQFKNISGNFLVSGSDIVRINTGTFQVDNSGIFKKYISGEYCEISNLNNRRGTLEQVNIQNLTVSGNVSSLNITGNKVNVSGQIDINQNLRFLQSSRTNSLEFASGVLMYATGENNTLGITSPVYFRGPITAEDPVTIRDNFYVTGNDIRFYGNIILGADQSNTVRLNGGWIGDIKPASDWLNEADDIYYDLGNPVARWRYVYAGKGVFHDSLSISGRLSVSGDTNITGRTTIGKDSNDTLRINATPTFTAPKVYIQNDLEISGGIKIGDISNDALEINSTATFNAPNTFFTQNVKIRNDLDVSGDLRTSGKIVLEGDQFIFSPDVNLYRASSGVLKTDSSLFIEKNLTVSGHATLGNGPEDDIHFSGQIDTNIIPNYSNTYNIGSTGLQYKNIYSSSTAFLNNANLSGNLEVSGTLNVGGVVRVDNHFSAITKSFLINHPTKENKKLQYACLEGPENGIYIRGSNDSSEILLPEYWKNLIDTNTISINLTPIGNINQICVLDYNSEKIIVSGHNNNKYFYTIFAERKDVEKLKVEI
jgi:cytoskeletal protein CcmA (bactofilin family)